MITTCTITYQNLGTWNTAYTGQVAKKSSESSALSANTVTILGQTFTVLNCRVGHISLAFPILKALCLTRHPPCVQGHCPSVAMFMFFCSDHGASPEVKSPNKSIHKQAARYSTVAHSTEYLRLRPGPQQSTIDSSQPQEHQSAHKGSMLHQGEWPRYGQGDHL